MKWVMPDEVVEKLPRILLRPRRLCNIFTTHRRQVLSMARYNVIGTSVCQALAANESW